MDTAGLSRCARVRLRRIAALALVVGLLALFPRLVWAQAPTAVCVTVITARSDAAAFERLVRDEVDRHASHRAVTTSECSTRLRVELIEVKEGAFLTARIDDTVPHRERVDGDDTRALGAALEQALTVVLHNDPTRLYGPDRDNFLSRQARTLRRKGQNLFGAELYQVGAVVEGGFDTMPGLALVARRELDAWHLGLRISGAIAPGEAKDETAHLIMLAGGAVEVMYFLDPLDDTSFYFGGQIGLDVQRFAGPANALEPGDRGETNRLVLGLGARCGAELFRTADARVNVFTHVTLPVMPSVDRDQGVIDQWVPSVGLGVGVVF